MSTDMKKFGKIHIFTFTHLMVRKTLLKRGMAREMMGNERLGPNPVTKLRILQLILGKCDSQGPILESRGAFLYIHLYFLLFLN